MKIIISVFLSFLLNISVAYSVANNSLNLDWLDKNVSIKNDFYSFANGGWIKNNPIPAEYASWGAFSVLHDENREKIHEMLIQASKDSSAKFGSIQQKVGDFYYSGMDVKNIDKLGIEPLKNEFLKINSIANLNDLQDVITHLHELGLAVGFGFSSMQDFKDSTKVIGSIEQSGLSLPSRDYYLDKNKKFQHIREEFIKHVTEMFVLLGDDRKLAREKADVVMMIETELAKASMTQIELRDPEAVYHIMDLQKLSNLTPNFSWKKYFKDINQSSLNYVNVGMPDFMRAFNKLLSSVSIDNWKTYLNWHLIDSTAAFLSKPFVLQNFKMSSVLSGAKTLPIRWKRVVSSENGFLGFAVGQLFVEKYFSTSDKKEVMEIIKNIRTVLRGDLQNVTWMRPETRAAAIKKLDLIEERVGFPEKWRDYSSLMIDRGPYVLNILRCSKFLVKYNLDKIGKPVDRTEWEMTPQTVNAYYNPSMNSINIPMGILQPPYFNAKAPAAINYGAIGVVIGHEITHGFDDQGAKFDAAGNLHDWWMPEDLKKFKSATDCIVDQYSKYNVIDDLFIQGKLVVGEATADLGGLILAYKAFHLSDQYKKAKNIDGYTPNQQFFLSFAHIWANNTRQEQAVNLITIDPHPPSKYRVNGTLANLPEFQAAFDISSQSMMVNKNRCVIW